MPTILNAGTNQLSNADVLQWIRQKRAQHKKEDDEDKASGRPAAKRPQKFMNSLRKHERELTDAKYPYIKNPGAYDGANRHKSISVFVEACDEEICYPVEEQYKQREDIPANNLKAMIAKEFDEKSLTHMEMLMIQNLAPENVSMLELMIEGWEQRFTSSEMETLVSIVNRVFRCGQSIPTSNGSVP